MFINNLAYFSLLIFSGANVPLESLPGWIQVISSAAAADARHRGCVSAGGWGGACRRLPRSCWGRLAIGIAYSLVGYVMFTVFEIEAKRRGTLELA